MAAVVPIMMIASTALTAYGMVKQGQAASAAADYNSKVAGQNSQIAAAQGEAASQQQQRDTQRKMGAMMAAYGASGVQMSDGSPADVLSDSVRSATLDNLTLKYNYKLRGLGFQQQQTLDNMQSENALTSSYFSAAGAAISGGAKAYGQGLQVPQFG